MRSGKRLPGGLSWGRMASASCLEERDGGKNLQGNVGGEQERDGCGGEAQVGGVGFVAAAQDPVGEGAGEEGEGGEFERLAEGAHSLRVEVEKVAEGECVGGGVLLEEGGEAGVGSGRGGVKDEESGEQGGERAGNEEGDGGALAGDDAGVGDGEGFGFNYLFIEPRGDKEGERGDGGEDVVLLAGGEEEEEERDRGPEAE